jgi:hypothetical protein
MVAGTVFAFSALGLYSILFKAYELVALARYQDNARAVLQTFVDQFELLYPEDAATGSPREIFIPTAPGLQYGTGKGLRYWNYTSVTKPGGLSNEVSSSSTWENDDQGMPVTLGGPQSGIPARVFRTVQEVDPGSPDTTTASAGGVFTDGSDHEYSGSRRLLLATFTIKYFVNNKPIVHQVSVIRADP